MKGFIFQSCGLFWNDSIKKLFTYDVGGNITSKKEYAVTSGTPTGSYVGSDYTYATDGWRDQMTSFRGETCVYDEIGNPTTYRNHNLSWTKVRRLASFDGNNFSYNAAGIRTKKDEITYTLDGNKILKQTKYGVDLTFYYGVNGIVGFNYWGTDYYYVKNLQGDVYEIYRDDYGTLTCVAKYVYDAWGNILAITDGSGTDVSTVADHIANVNPIRYRSYYYDRETNLYYLETRYYDPETGRFLNADSIDYLDPETIQGVNLYAYCLNNPVNRADTTGNWSMPNWLKVVVGVVTTVAAVTVTVVTGGAVAPVLIGVAVSTIGGAAMSAINHRVNTGSWEGTAKAALDGAADGFMWGGVFALGGATVRGISYAHAVRTNNYDRLAKLFTHNKFSKKVMLGKYDGGASTSYIAKAGHTHTYFQMPSRIFDKLKMNYGDDIWLINQSFLNQQIGKQFCFSHPIESATGYFLREINYLKSMGII